MRKRMTKRRKAIKRDTSLDDMPVDMNRLESDLKRILKAKPVPMKKRAK